MAWGGQAREGRRAATLRLRGEEGGRQARLGRGPGGRTCGTSGSERNKWFTPGVRRVCRQYYICLVLTIWAQSC